MTSESQAVENLTERMQAAALLRKSGSSTV